MCRILIAAGADMNADEVPLRLSTQRKELIERVPVLLVASSIFLKSIRVALPLH